MKTIKRKTEHFQLYDYSGMELHLAEMALKGWKLEKITASYWQYRKIEPQALSFTVTYHIEASEFNPCPTDGQKTFYSYCEESGWFLVAQRAQMQIFCSELENPTPIETDEAVKLQAIHKSMKKTFIPAQITFIFLFFFQTLLLYYGLISNPVLFLSSSAIFYSALLIIAVGGGFTLLLLIRYTLWYCNSKKSISMGGACLIPSKSYKRTQFLNKLWLGVIFVIVAAFLLNSLGDITIAAVIIGFLPVPVIFLLILAVKNILKRNKVSKKVNFAVTMITLIICSFTIPALMMSTVLSEMNIDFIKDNAVGTYTKHFPNRVTIEFDMYDDPLPLKIEDLETVTFDDYSYQWTANETFLISHYEATQRSYLYSEETIPELSYEIVDAKSSLLFDICLRDYLERYHWKNAPEEYWDTFLEISPLPWQADNVYQLSSYDYGAQSTYIVCWGYRILFINFDEIPTEEQMAIITDKIKLTDLASIE